MEAMVSMVFFLSVLTADVLSVLLLKLKRPGFAVAAGAVALAVTPLALRFWRQALVQSGKSTALLGFGQYPAVGVLAALVCIGLGAVRIRKR